MNKWLIGSLDRIDMFAVAAFTVPLFVYLLTLAPSVTFFDSGEFVTAIYSLGSAHSPGYPFFINYAKLFTYLPFGNIAFRVNIATAVSAAISCYGVYLLVSHMLDTEKLTEDETFSYFFKNICALSAALTFAFSARLWLQSNHDKPYPIISFLAAMIFYLLMLWREHYRQQDERPAYVYLSAFFCGLGFGAHQTMILLLPSFVFLILSLDWRMIGRIKEIILAIAFGLLGFSVHLHLPIRATQNPLLNWGDAKTYSQFVWHFFRKGYPNDYHERDMKLLWEQINAFNIMHEFTVAGLVVLILGLVYFFRKRRDEILAYLLGIFFFLLVIAGYFNALPDMIFLTEEFFTPLYLLSAVFIGIGMFWILGKAVSIVPEKQFNTIIMRLVLGVVLFSLPVTVCALHYIENDQHENYIAYDYATNSLRSLPERAVLYTWGDSGAFPLWYLQGVEKMRDDTDLLHTPHLVFLWYLDSFPDLFRNSVLRQLPENMLSPEYALKTSISEFIGRRPVYVDFSTRYSVALDPFGMIQHGICYQLTPNFAGLNPPDILVWNLYILRGLGSDMFFRDLDTSKAILIYANSHLESAETLLRLGRKGEGFAELKSAEAISPELNRQAVQIGDRYGYGKP